MIGRLVQATGKKSEGPTITKQSKKEEKRIIQKKKRQRERWGIKRKGRENETKPNHIWYFWQWWYFFHDFLGERRELRARVMKRAMPHHTLVGVSWFAIYKLQNCEHSPEGIQTLIIALPDDYIVPSLGRSILHGCLLACLLISFQGKAIQCTRP